jgi:signal transduction histidine kinase
MALAPRRTLAWRLAVLGLVQLVLLAGAVVGVGVLLAPPRGQGPVAAQAPGAPEQPPGALAPPRERHRPSPVGPLLTFFLSGVVIVGAGSVLTARWIVEPLDAMTRASRALGSGDLTARTGLRRRDELGEVGRAFDEMADRVQALLLAERELLANVSHELRTPLARIRVALDIASEGDGQTGRASMAEIAVDLTEIEALIDDILTTSRLDIAAGKGDAAGFPLHRAEVPARELCDRATERFRARHPMRPFGATVAEGAGKVSADPVLFRRVLDNLLDNADKYSADPAAPVTLRVEAVAGGVVFAVSDRGVGIPPEDLRRVFAPFFRGERSRSRVSGGVGLGLTLAKRIVEAHGGRIEVTSKVGEGTTVRVTVPAVPASR